MKKVAFTMLPFELDRFRGWWWILTLALIAVCVKWPVIVLLLTLFAWRAGELFVTWKIYDRVVST